MLHRVCSMPIVLRFFLLRTTAKKASSSCTNSLHFSSNATAIGEHSNESSKTQMKEMAQYDEQMAKEAVEEKDVQMVALERVADRILEERRLRPQRRAEGIMYDEEILDGRVVQFNYAGEFCEQRGIGDIHKQLRRFIICCSLLGAVAFALVKVDLTKKRRRKMWERQKKLHEARKEALKKQKQLALDSA